jgi:putative MFS transporter
MGSISARLDRLPLSRYHYTILGMLGVGIFFDGVDNFILSGIVAALTRVGFTTAQSVAHLVSFSFIGLFLGAILTGMLCDRYGRRTMFVWNMLIYSIGSLLCAIAPSYTFLLIARIISSFGIGGEVVAVYTFFGEIIPPKKRGTWMGVIYLLNTFSLPITTFIGMMVIPMGVNGWRWMFVIAGIPAIFAYFIQRRMPESPRWYEANGRHEEAERIVSKVEADIKAKTGKPLPPVVEPEVAAAVPQELKSIGILFKSLLLKRTVLAIIIYVAVSIIAYSFITWLPTMLVGQGIDITKSLAYTTVMVVGNPVGGLIAIMFSDRVSRKWATVVLAALGGIVAYTYAFSQSVTLMLVLGFAFAALTSAICAITWYTYIPELFPTAVRARGLGLSGSLGRLATAGSPYLVVALSTAYGFPSIMIGIAVLYLITVIFTALLGVETRNKSLEEINENLLKSASAA